VSATPPPCAPVTRADSAARFRGSPGARGRGLGGAPARSARRRPTSVSGMISWHPDTTDR
jgi:hypothetical protein